MQNNKLYIVKNLAPWMADELKALADFTDFTLILLRPQKEIYSDTMSYLISKNVKIINLSYSKWNLSTLLRFLLLLIRHINKLTNKKNVVFTLKSISWFTRMDKSIFKSCNSIHAQFATQSAILAYLVKKHVNKDIEYSFTVHAYDIYYSNSWLNQLASESETVFTISKFNIDYLEKKYSIASEKIQLARLGVFRPSNIETKEVENTITVGFLSWFEQKKGIFYLIDALKMAKRNGIGFNFYLAGGGPLEEEILESIKEAGIEKNTKFLGKVFNEQKELYFRQLDLFILPSIKVPGDMDGIPVVLMEAISYGIPIISTNISGIPEICKDQYDGYLIPEKSSEAIYNVLLTLSKNNKHIQKMKINALEMSQKYDIIKNTKIKFKKILWL